MWYCCCEFSPILDDGGFRSKLMLLSFLRLSLPFDQSLTTLPKRNSKRSLSDPVKLDLGFSSVSHVHIRVLPFRICEN